MDHPKPSGPTRKAARTCRALVNAPGLPFADHLPEDRILALVKASGASFRQRLFGPAVDVARRLEREARAELGIPLAVGVAVNKLVSETAAAVVKREAGADIWPVAHGHEAPFLAPEAVAVLPDVPTRVRERLDDYHLVRVGQVAAIGEQALQTAFGREGRTLHRHAHGIDLRPVIPPEIQAECRVGHTLATDTNDRRALHALLRPMAERLGRRLRERGFAAGRLVIAIRHVDDATASRGITLPPGVLDLDLWRAACRPRCAICLRWPASSGGPARTRCSRPPPT